MHFRFPTTPVVLALVATVVVIDVSVSEESWDNEWDGELNFECPRGQVLSSVYSVHDDSKEDRRWRLECAAAPSGANPRRCRWTSDYVNTWEEPISYMPRRNWILAGVFSKHNNDHEDRIMKFRYCTDNSYVTISCGLTEYLNDFDAPLNYTVPEGKVLAGWVSMYEGSTRDRRHKMIECSYGRIAPPP